MPLKAETGALERGIGGGQRVLTLQTFPSLVPVPTSGSSQPRVIPVSGDLVSASWGTELTCPHRHEHINVIKVNL